MPRATPPEPTEAAPRTSSSTPAGPPPVRAVGRYDIHGVIGVGGMATVHLGQLRGAAGFRKVVAVKRMHAHYAANEAFAAMFLAEARLASRVQHPNVVTTLDVLSNDGELFMVMELVAGETLAVLLEAAGPAPVRPPLACQIVCDTLRGLHAAHEAADERGEPLGLVHRDISPQNIIVGLDGVTRVLDFGIAKAAGEAQITEDGVVKGKAAYMAPEQIFGERLDRRADVYAAGVVLWELLTGRRLFPGGSDCSVMQKALELPIDAPGLHRPELGAELDAIVLRAVARDAEDRFASADEMARALAPHTAGITPEQVGDWVRQTAGDRVTERQRLIASVERASLASSPAEPRRFRGAPLAIAAFVAAAAGVSVLALTGAGSPPETIESLNVPGVAAAMATTTEPLPAATIPSPEPDVHAPAGEREQAVDGGSATASASASPRLSWPSSSPRPGESTAPLQSASPCDPPYRIDARGHKRFKRHCF